MSNLDVGIRKQIRLLRYEATCYVAAKIIVCKIKGRKIVEV